MFRLDGKTVLLTGATGHLGRQLALILSEFGAHVCVNARNIDACDELVSFITDAGGSASIACFDVTDDKQVFTFSKSIELIDVLINNAYSGKGGTIETADSSDYVSSYLSSVVATANLTKVLLPHFRKAVVENGYASVINISSMYGLVSPDHRIYEIAEGTNPPFYGAAKAALIQWTRYAACEFAKENIRFNSISPGPFPSDKVQHNSPKLVDKIVSKVPMNRIGQPIDLAGAVVFLSSNASSFVTGINLPVDGGWTAW
jgi:NAD(P)-dependent dehydrogenase (short-subunit alcohol dehydrogenase family)